MIRSPELLGRDATIPAGVVLPHAQLDAELFFARLGSLGIAITRSA